jgi:hypothetical protein
MALASGGVSAGIVDVWPGLVGVTKGTGLIAVYLVGEMMAPRCP